MSRRRPEAAGLPSVNLLSESAFARLAVRRLRQRFVAGGVVMLLLVGGAWAFQHLRVEETRKLVAVEQAETTRLTGQTQVLAPVRTFVNGVAVQQRTVESAMGSEVYISDVLDGVRDATPPGAQLTTVAVTIAATAAVGGAAVAGAVSACPGPDPFNTRTVVGCVTLSGTAGSRAEVGDMVIALGASHLFVEPFISTTTTGDGEAVTFSGSVGLSEKVYSGRYAAAPADATAAAPDTAEGGS
ncbi:PilN domain-containing protein [Nocardioides sp.]|uniref:PilN domain-containing protein n=1 Tax=Nocardioides sp. TaxID=35761 RepID=UPI002613F856|nr:PilN domain-containing protein [Nocardioides sp.]MDI6911846.1 PilN domain-containing protein [Nocardioides sp.]